MKWRSFRWKEYHWVVPCQSTVLYCKMQVLTFIFKSNSPINLWIEFYSFRFQLHMSIANSIHQLLLHSFSVGGLSILSILILLKHTNCQLKSNSNIMFPVHDFDDGNVGMMYAWSLHFQRLENLEEVIKSFCKNFVLKNVEMHCIETAFIVKIFYFSTTFNGKYGLFQKFIFKHISNLLLTHLSLSANNKLE